MEDQTDLLAPDLQCIRSRKRTQNEVCLENHNSIHKNEHKSTHVSRPTTSASECYANRPLTSALYRPAPFSDDPEAIETRVKCDYSIRISKEMASSGKAPRPVRVYADGIYDLFHQGHARLLMQAKNAFPEVYLIAGVNGDFITHQNKGKTIMTEDERYEAVRHCRYVDEVIKDAQWIPDERFLEEHKIDFVAHDDIPYPLGSPEDIYKYAKSKGMFVATQRTEGISTSDLVARIVKDYETYVRRNLDRGYTAEELNLSFFGERKILLQSYIQGINGKIEGKGQSIFQKCEQKSREIINFALSLFGRDGILNIVWKESTEMLRQVFSFASTLSGNPMRKKQIISAPSSKIT